MCVCARVRAHACVHEHARPIGTVGRGTTAPLMSTPDRLLGPGWAGYGVWARTRKDLLSECLLFVANFAEGPYKKNPPQLARVTEAP